MIIIIIINILNKYVQISKGDIKCIVNRKKTATEAHTVAVMP